MKSPKHPGLTLCDLSAIEDVTPQVRRWTWAGVALSVAWAGVLGLLIWCAPIK